MKKFAAGMRVSPLLIFSTFACPFFLCRPFFRCCKVPALLFSCATLLSIPKFGQLVASNDTGQAAVCCLNEASDVFLDRLFLVLFFSDAGGPFLSCGGNSS
jgi:hypothetical protein